MKAAICTTDGISVDLHFGKTSDFHIYEISGGNKSFIEKRSIPKYSPGKNYLEGEKHEPDFGKINKITELIGDCSKLYTCAIGEKPKELLEEEGISIQICNCRIDEIPVCNCNCK